MREKGVGVVAWQVQSRSPITDETAHPLHYLLGNLPLSHVM